ncbi:DRC2 protein, partial [Pseudoatta argentina]
LIIKPSVQQRPNVPREAEERAKMWKKNLMREIELGTLNTKRYRTLWREMMTRIKMPQIAEDVKIAWHNFDRALDIKDYRLSYAINWPIDKICLDKFIHLYNFIRISLICNSILYTYTHVHSQFRSKIDAFVEDSKDIRRISVTQLENQLQKSWENLRRILSDYQNETKDRRKSYETLKNKDEKDQQVIAQQLLYTTSLFEDIQKFQNKITTYDSMAKKKISKILTEYDFFQKASSIFKNRLLSVARKKLLYNNNITICKIILEQTKDKNQLKILSIKCNKMIKHLEFLVIKGKRLLTLMQICRKYEIQNEKIIPLVNHTESSQMLSYQIIALSDCNVSRQIRNLRQIIDFQDMTNFWRQFSIVQMTTLQLRSKRDKLKAEARYLRERISFYIMQKE